MAIPDYQTVILPLLQIIDEKGPISIRDATNLITSKFQLSKEERATLLPSGNQEIMLNRVGWARTYMKKAGLLSSPERVMVEITERGKQVRPNEDGGKK